MREIKFSIILQHEETGSIVDRRFSYADIFNGTAKEEIGKLERYAVIAQRQYTGLLDKNGKEIYGGDILYLESSYLKRYEVYWNEDRWGLKHGYEDYDSGDYYRGDDINNWDEWEITGNIYENPELLDVNKPVEPV